MRTRFVFAVFVGLILAALPAQGTILVYQTLEELASSSSEVALGRVLAVECLASRESKSVYTVVTLEVEETLKGSVQKGQQIRIQFFGGERDGLAVRYTGMPVFRVGEEAVVFAKWKEADLYSLVGLSQGKVEITREGGEVRAIRRLAGIPILVAGTQPKGLDMGKNEILSLDVLRERVRRSRGGESILEPRSAR